MYHLMSKIVSFFYLSSLFSSGIRPTESNAYTKSIYFNYYGSAGQKRQVITMDNITSYDSTVCNISDSYALITHGWTESCNESWMIKLIANLNKYRGGCIICMDYSRFSKSNYFKLVGQFRDIKAVVISKLQFLDRKGFNPDKSYLFGFSYGAHLIIEAAERRGLQKYKQIDVCDMAGPGFDNKRVLRRAAKNVQCIHTSRDRGTNNYGGCHQNWRMGVCGIRQPGAKRPPYGSHGLCPIYYNLAFEYEFYAMKNYFNCSSSREASTWPKGFKMGYLENRKEQVQGELFSKTTAAYPYIDDGSKNVNYNINVYDDGLLYDDFGEVIDDSFFEYYPSDELDANVYKDALDVHSESVKYEERGTTKLTPEQSLQ